MNDNKLEPSKILSDIIVHSKYARYLPEEKRREGFGEIVDRTEKMMLNQLKKLGAESISELVKESYGMVRKKKILPSMRCMQFAGAAIEKNNSRIYNCSYLPMDDYRAFREVMFLLLGGTGVGYSVQKQHIDKLPPVYKPYQSQKFLIGDSIEGWSDAIDALIRAYLVPGNYRPEFNYDDIRPKGTYLVTAGGKAPGPEPLKKCLKKIENILIRVTGRKLKPIEVHDICCHIADAVLAGGIRRAAMISLFSEDDEEMANCKTGAWWETNLQRSRANNSAVMDRKTITKGEFMNLWKATEESGSGEPGSYFTWNLDWGTNPCVETSLRPGQFCNLAEINGSNIKDQVDFEDRCAAAAVIGTMQASFTDFHYLRPIWKETTEKEALLGIGITGIASGSLDNINLKKGAEVVKNLNMSVSKELGINPAARSTCVKPSGTTSLVLGCSSGIHPYHSKYYIRRVRINKSEPILSYLKEKMPKLLEEDVFDNSCYVLSIPLKAPEGAITREEESPFGLLQRAKHFSKEWIFNGHRYGDNLFNVSVTASVEDKDWDALGQWIWKNKDYFNGISVLPYDGGTYKQAPFESITEEKYNEMKEFIIDKVDLTEVIEEEDFYNLQEQAACAGGACEV